MDAAMRRLPCAKNKTPASLDAGVCFEFLTCRLLVAYLAGVGGFGGGAGAASGGWLITSSVVAAGF